MVLKYFFPLLVCLFILLIVSFTVQIFSVITYVIQLLLLVLFGVLCKNHCQTQCHEHFFYVFFWTFIVISHFISWWSEKMFCMVSAFLNVLKFILWPNIWSFLENVPYALEKKVYSAAVGWCVLYMSLRSSWFIMLFKSSVFLLISVQLFYPLLKVGYVYI